MHEYIVHCGKVNKCGLNQKKKKREIRRTKTQTQQSVESKHSHSLLVGSNDFCIPWKSIWKQKILSRVAFFVWIAALGKCLTIDNLRKKKVWILDWCYMCKCNGESVDHLFLYCPVAMDMWAMVFGLFGVSWVMP